MSLNRGKIKVEPNATNAKKNPVKITSRILRTGYTKAWDPSRWLGTPEHPSISYGSMNNDLKQNTMNVPEGYHLMPDGSLMSNDQMKCGGDVSNRLHRQFGGDSKSPQNMTIDGVGQARTDLMKNYLSANVYGAMLDQEAAMLSPEGFAEGGSVYNQNMYGQEEYAGAIDATRKQFKKDWKNFGNAFQNVVNSSPRKGAANPQGQPQQLIEQPMTNNDPSGFGSQAGGFGDGMNEGFQSPFAMPELMYGGNLPEMANGGEDDGPAGWPPGQPWLPLFDQLGYSKAEEEAKWKKQFEANKKKFGNLPTQVNQTDALSTAPIPNLPQNAPATNDPTINAKPATIQLSDAEVKGTNTTPAKRSVSAATKKKAKQSTVGKTPAARKEIEAAQREVAREAAPIRGNYTEAGKPSAVSSESYTANQGNSQQMPIPGYGGGRMKIKGVDPETGKRFKIKYDTAYSPRDFGNGRGRGPRVIKYDIYNNPVYMEEHSEAAQIVNEVAPRQFNELNPDINAPNFDPRFPQGQGAFSNGNQTWYNPSDFNDDFQPVNEFALNNPSAPAYFTEDDYRSMNQPNQPQLDVSNYTQAPGVGNQYENLRPRQVEEVPGETTPANLNERFMKQVNSDFEQGFNYGGNYPMMVEGGPFNNEGSAALGEDAYAAGPESGSYVDETGALVTYGDKPKPDMKAKLKGNNDGFNQWAPMILPAMDMISSIAEQGDARRNEAQLQNLKQASNVFTPNTDMNRGKHTINQGYFDPSNMVATQFTGNDQGAIGSPNVYSQYGGEMQSGEYYLTEDEIKKVMAMGGQIEYL